MPSGLAWSKLTVRLSYQFSDAIEDRVNDLFADGVVTTSVVISRILFARDQLLWVEELAVGTSADLIWNKMFT